MDITSTRSKSDLKLYRIITLPSCGLEVLLISSLDRAISSGNEESLSQLKSAASMSVQVGSFADPLEAEGCAHFLEHMVFMGSEKYPKENHYDNFVSSNGGSCNAFTEGEHTVYQFDISSQHFSEALDIFAHCFISPLLSFSSSDREIEAIDSEFNIARMDDYNRWQQILFSHAINNPIIKQFSWGNKKSLSTIPKKKGVNMELLLKSFHRKYYVPHHMKLVVIGPQSLDELQSHVESSFGDWTVDTSSITNTTTQSTLINVKTSNKMKKRQRKTNYLPTLISLDERLQKYINESPIPIDKMCTLYRISPIKKIHKLIMTWQLPSVMNLYKTKPLHFIGHLLGFEGPGSVLSAFKKLGYAHSVSAGVSGSNMEENSMFTIFSVTVKMTLKGLANWFHIVKIIHQYLDIIRNASKERLEIIFQELKAIDLIKYDYLDEEEEEDIVERLAVSLLPYNKIDRDDILSSAIVTPEWDGEMVSYILKTMTPDTTRLDLLSPLYNVANHDPDHDDNYSTEDDGDEEEDDGEEEDGDEDDDDEHEEDEHEDEENEDGDDNDMEIDMDVVSLYQGPSQWLHLIIPPTNNPHIEPYFNTKYWSDSIPSTLIDYWNNFSDTIPSSLQIEYDNNIFNTLSLPASNEFIPSNLNLVPNDNPVIPGSIETINFGLDQPKNICSRDGLEVWYFCDNIRFPVPKVEITFRLVSKMSTSPFIRTNVNDISGITTDRDGYILAAILHDLSIATLRDILNETMYVASIAELYGEIFDSRNVGVGVRVSGFSYKSLDLVHKIIQTYLHLPSLYLSTVPSNENDDTKTDNYYSNESFHRELENLVKIYENSDMKSSHATSNAKIATLVPSFPSNREKYDYLKKYSHFVDKNMLRVYLSKVMEGLYVEGLIQGNIFESQAHNFIQALENIVLDPFDSSWVVLRDKLTTSAHPHQLVVEIPTISVTKSSIEDQKDVINTKKEIEIEKEKLCSILITTKPQSKDEKNICVEFYFQVGPYDVGDDAILDLLDQVISEPYFDDLRTKQQLGYSVSCRGSTVKGILGYSFSVLSSSYSVPHVQTAILNFINGIENLITNLSEEEFQIHKQAVINNKLLPFISLYEAAKDNWISIESRRYDFTSRKVQAMLLQMSSGSASYIYVDKTVLIEFVRKIFFDNRKLLIIQANIHSSKESKDISMDNHNNKMIESDTIMGIMTAESDRSDPIMIDVSSSYENLHGVTFHYYESII